MGRQTLQLTNWTVEFDWLRQLVKSAWLGKDSIPALDTAIVYSLKLAIIGCLDNL